MRRIDIFVSSPEDVQKERSLVERTIRAVAGEFGVPIAVTYSNWLRPHNPLDNVAKQGANGSEDGRTWLCPCFWEYRDSGLDQEYREQIPNTGAYDLVISILWSRLGTRVSPAFVLPDGSQPKTANEYEIAWVLDQLDRTPGFPELWVYRNRSIPPVPEQPKPQREAFFREWDGVQEFFSAWENKKAFVDACSNYSDLEEFEGLFRTHFRDFLARQLQKEIVPREKPTRGRYWKSEPFRGLRFFDFEHSTIFHGRTKAVGEVLDAMASQVNAKTPFVMLLGASGSGKSSLVRAGVLPLLTEVGAKAGEGPWRYAVTRPGAGGDPFDSLAASLLAKSALPELQRAKVRDDWRNLAAEMKGDPEKIALQITEVLDRISAQELDDLLSRENDRTPTAGRIESTELVRHRKLRRGKPKAQIALFIDQLEELFTGGFSLGLQHQYFGVIAALVRSQRVCVIAALGTDYYTTYQQFPELVALTKPSGRFDLQAPTRTELGRIIRAPAEASGLSFERDAKTGQGLDDGLLDAALSSADQLPLLEHLLSMLYRKQLERADGRLRWSDYVESGELDGALAVHAEEVFTKLSSDARQAFDFVMRRLAPAELEERASVRVALYRDLISAPELESRLRAGAKEFADSMVREGLFASETDFRQEVVISVGHPALCRKWPRFREWLIEDQEFLRMRDRVEGCLKSWLKRGRRTHDLLSPGGSLADGETLINHFRSSLSNEQIEYIHKSLKDQKRGRRIGYLLWLPLVVALAALAAVVGVRWFNHESLRESMEEFGKVERKLSELAQSDRGGNEAELKEAEEKARLAQQNAALFSAQRNAIEAQLKKAQESAKQTSELALAERNTLETQLKQAQDKLQEARQNADQASTQRGPLETQLKQAQDKLQQAQQDADLAWSQRGALETQLKQAQDKLQEAQQNADQASSQRAALETELKQTQDKLQEAQQNADLASSQRGALETQLKQTQDKLQLAQQNADQASRQQTALGTQLKQAQDKLQLAQQNADQASRQRTALEAQLKQAQEKLQQAQQNTDLASTQRGALEAELKQAQDKLQQAQQTADQASSRRGALETQLRQAQQSADMALAERAGFETQLKQAQDKLQQAQQSADPASKQRAALEGQLKQAQDKLQQVQQNADAASSQRAALEAQLKQAQDKLQQAQQNADAASSQRAALEGQLKQAQDKLQQAQQNADAASNQRVAAETQLKQAHDKLQQAQQNADEAFKQRGAVETEFKESRDKLQQAQQNADAASNQRAALATQLQQAQDELRRAQQSAELASSQRAGFETQLKQAQDKLQQAQQSADLASSQRAGFETQLKEVKDKLRQVQQSADLSASERADLQARLKKAEENLQLARQRADVATSQRTALEAQLREAEEKAQLAQKIADLVAAQARPEDNGAVKGDAAKTKPDSANQNRSGRALPLDAGQNPGPGTSTQPLIQPVQSGNH